MITIIISTQLRHTTESLWRALYDYSGSEKSIGVEVDGEISALFLVFVERVKGRSIKKKYEITIIPIEITPFLVTEKNGRLIQETLLIN